MPERRLLKAFLGLLTLVCACLATIAVAGTMLALVRIAEVIAR